MSKVLAIIPARGGSKGIPGKNLVEVGGRPLIDWSIQTGLELLQLESINRLIVSTDDEKIAQHAREKGVEVPFLRPPGLAQDSSKSVEYVRHALDHFRAQDFVFEAVLVLQPTCPRRDPIAIAQAISRFFELGMDSMISCYLDQYVSQNVLYQFDDDPAFVQPISPGHSAGLRRQEEESFLVRAGVMYLARTDFVRKHSRLIGDRPGLFLVSKLESLNLDTNEDLELLRATF